jgi:hypothetical protein
MKAMSEADIIKELQYLAEKTKITKSKGDSAALERIDNRKNVLRTQYISSASPDRKTLFEQAKRTLNNDQQKLGKFMGEMNLVNFLIEHDKPGLNDKIAARLISFNLMSVRKTMRKSILVRYLERTARNQKRA